MSGSTEAPALVEIRDHVMVITINRPEAKNAMSLDVAIIIEAALDRLDSERELRVAVLTGAGGVFCAGADLKRLALGEIAYSATRGFGGIVDGPPKKPIIAAVEGLALGGGFEIALACDLIVAGASSYFALPEVKRGLIARGGGAVRLPRRIPRAIALEVLLLGSRIESDRAANLGLVNRVTADGDALKVALELAEEIASNAPLSVQGTKRLVVESESWAAEDLISNQAPVTDEVFNSNDAKEGVAAFGAKRRPVWSGT